MSFVATFVDLIFEILIFAIFIRAILSWFRLSPSNPLINLLDTLTEPVLGPVRRILPAMGGMDFSPMVAIVLLVLIQGFLRSVLR